MNSDALSLSSRSFELLAHALPGAVFLIDRGGKIQFVNANAEQFFGYSAGSLRGESIGILVPERARPELEKSLEELFDASVGRAAVERFQSGLRRDGREIPIDMNLIRIASSEGPWALAVVAAGSLPSQTDEADQFLAAVVQSTDDAVVGLHLDGVIRTWNQSAERTYGYTASEMIGRTMAGLLPPDRRDEEDQILARLRRGERVAHFETVRVRKDGVKIDVSVTIAPIRDAAGRVTGVSKVARDITERKRAEAALREQEFRNRAILDHTYQFIGVLSVDGILLDVNRTALQFAALEARDVVGQWFWETPWFRHSIPLQRKLRQSVSRAAAGEFVRFDISLPSAVGEIHHVDFSLNPVTDDSGNVVMLIPEGRDITERQRLEDERERFFSHSLDLLGIAGTDGFFHKVNPAFTRVLGYSEAELLGKPFADFIHPDDLASTQAEVEKLATGVNTVGFENRYRCRDGSYRLLRWNAVPDPETGMILASARDVTEDHERVRLLALGRDVGVVLARGGALRTMLQSCAETLVGHLGAAFARIWTLSESGEHLELQASAGMYTHLDGPHGRVPIGHLKIGTIARERKPHLTNQVVGDPLVADQEWARRERMVAFAGHPLIVDGSLVGVAALFSRHTLSEATLAALGSAADTIAVAISRKRIEEALARSEAEAQAANRAKSEFLALMSHEIRTPMNGVLGMTRLTLNTDVTAQQREYLEMCHRSAESLLDIINDILDFSKIEAGKFSLDSSSFSLRQWIENVVKDMGLRARAKNIELVFEIGRDVPDRLIGDPGRLRQVLINLVGNAIKFTDTGEVALTVRRHSMSDEEIWLTFAVRDSGVGIPPDKLETIFKAFEQADTSITRTHGGTGLGLTISSRLVAMMGGALNVESQAGAGSTFSFRARFQPSNEPLPQQSIQQLPELRGLRVLVVDDNATNRRILQDTLVQWNMRPHCVSSGPEALEAMHAAAVDGSPFTLVLLDAMMPDMDGFIVAEKLRSSTVFDGAMIMMLSSADQQEDIERCRSVGIQSYLTKPVTSSVLLNSVMELLSQVPPAGDSTARPVDRTSPEPADPTPKLRVLLADDNIINQKVTLGTLKAKGHEVMVANNGREAVAAWEKHSFDVILMDVQMPEMDGFQATAVIREREQSTGSRIPIIALTAHAMKSDQDLCIAAGMDGYVSKPTRPDDLMRVIRTCLVGSDSAAKSNDR